MLCDLHIEFRLCLTIVLYIRNTKRVKTCYCCLGAIKPIGVNTFLKKKSGLPKCTCAQVDFPVDYVVNANNPFP